ncbi:MAG: hypothetical protein AAB956_00600 [Patescibacteria group bacterium]
MMYHRLELKVKKSWAICFHYDPAKVQGEPCGGHCGNRAVLLVTFGGEYGFSCDNDPCRNAVAKQVMDLAPKSPEMIAQAER